MENNENKIVNLPMNELFDDEDFNCRGPFNITEVVDLAKSIERDGLLSPIIVSTLPSNHPSGKKYRIISGYRRFYAHRVIKKDIIQCIVRENLPEQTARILNLTENLGRKDLNIVQEAKAILPLMKLGMSEQEIAKSLPGASRGWIQVRVMLLKLPKEVQAEASAGLINQTQIRNLYTAYHKDRDVENVLEMVRHIKDAKTRAEGYKKLRTNKKQTNTALPIKDSKKMRDKAEIFLMIDKICNQMHSNIGTICLAWASGEISNFELENELNEYAKTIGKTFSLED